MQLLSSKIKVILSFSIVYLFFSCESDDNFTTLPSEELTYEHFFNEPNQLKLHELQINITQSEWDRLIALLNDNIKSDDYVKANLIYRDAPGTLDMVDTVFEIGFRIRGNTTRRLPYKNGEYRRAHFKLKFDKNFDFSKGSPAYVERKKRTFANIEALNLKWGREGNENDVSQIREIYQYDMMRKAGVYVPKTTSCHLILNVDGHQVDYGVYTAIEPIDDTFLDHYFGHDDGDLYKCLWKNMGPAVLTSSSAYGDKVGESDADTYYEPSYDLKEGDLSTGRLRSFISSLEALKGDDFKAYIDENFDVDRFLRFTAMNMILGMPDDYWGMGNNYYLFFPDNGKITFIPYDYDHGLGGGWHPFNTAQANIHQWWSGTGSSTRPLMKILDVSEYVEQYEMYLESFALSDDAIFSYDNYNHNFFSALHTLYLPFLDNDTDEGEAFEHYGEEHYFSSKKSSLSRQLK